MKKSKLGYRGKLFVLVSVLTWLTVTVFVVFSFTRDQQYRTDLLNSKMQSANEFIAESHVAGGKSWKELDSINADVRITVLNLEGEVLYDHSPATLKENHSDRSEFKNALEKGSGYTIRRASKSDERDYFYSATLCDSIVVRSAVPYGVSLTNTLHVDYTYIGILIFIGVVVTIIAWMFLSRATQSIRTLRDFAVNAENDPNFNPDDYSFPNDELGEISDEIVSLYNKQKKSSQSATENMNQLLHEEQEKTRIKQQLSSNMSHELKTPIHAINACLETLNDNFDNLNNDTTKDLIGRSLEQSKRLVALVNDLSLITRLSDGRLQISTNRINITDVVKDIVSEIELLPVEKRMRVHVNMPERVEIDGNRDLIESIFRNLVTNALDYSGGRDIFIEMIDKDAEKVYFRFADNGIGVSSEHLTKIFERFYRPDEGRNRKQGGTGLGLSIVKNAIHFHGGDVAVENLETGGLQFKFSFSINNEKKA